MQWVKGLVFTALVPTAVGYFIPLAIDPRAHGRGGIWDLGWLPIAAGTLIYLLCLIRFLAAGGTPAIFFSRSLRTIVGEEPPILVSTGLYRYSRNPMYVGVLLAVFGEAMLFASPLLVIYGLALFAFLQSVIVFAEEPHLRTERGHMYEDYCRSVPRWLGFPLRNRSK